MQNGRRKKGRRGKPSPALRNLELDVQRIVGNRATHQVLKRQVLAFRLGGLFLDRPDFQALFDTRVEKRFAFGERHFASTKDVNPRTVRQLFCALGEDQSLWARCTNRFPS